MLALLNEHAIETDEILCIRPDTIFSLHLNRFDPWIKTGKYQVCFKNRSTSTVIDKNEYKQLIDMLKEGKK
jgi:hypothetical protein